MEIKLDNVCVDIPVFNSQGRSLKKTVMGFATGGKVGLTESGKTVVRCLDNVCSRLVPMIGLAWSDTMEQEEYPSKGSWKGLYSHERKGCRNW